MSDLNAANIPGASPLVDSNGQITMVWYQFLLALFNRTGGTGTPTDITNLQKQVTAQDVEINTAVPVQPQPVLIGEGIAPVQRPQQTDFSQQMVYQPPGAYVVPNTAVTFATIRASLAAKVFAQNTAAQSIPVTTVTTVTGWTAPLNTGTNFVASTGVFTAPRAGQYLVIANLTLNTAAWTAGTVGQIFIAKNGTSISATGQNVAAAGSIAMRLGSIVSVVDCAVGDTITIQVSQNSGAAITLANTGIFNTLSITELP